MTDRTAIKSRSATAMTDTTIGRAFKRTFLQAEHNDNPTLHVIPPDNASTETIVNENATLINVDETQARYFATKLDRNSDKEARFKSHKDFLTRCLKENVIPFGLGLQLEPSIGNHDDEFCK